MFPYTDGLGKLKLILISDCCSPRSFKCPGIPCRDTFQRYQQPPNPWLLTFLYFSNVEFSRWCASCPTAHLAGGMKSTNTSLKIPQDGRYFVYCQFHLLQTDADRTGFEILVNGSIFLSKVVKGEEATYSGAVFSMKKNSIISVRLLGPGTIEGDHTVNFLGAYRL